MGQTARYGLVLLQPGQAQKEMTHNEALSRIDALLYAVVEGAPLDATPATPQEGECWIVGDAPSGDFAGQARSLAVFTEGGWRFVSPREGLRCHDAATGRCWRFVSGAWVDGRVDASSVRVGGQQVLGDRQPAISGAAGGTTIDAKAREAIDAILAAMRSHGLIET